MQLPGKRSAKIIGLALLLAGLHPSPAAADSVQPRNAGSEPAAPGSAQPPDAGLAQAAVVAYLGPAQARRADPTPSAAGPGRTAVAADSTDSHQLSPRGALVRSAVLPGWGQVLNGHPIRGAAFAGVTVGLVAWAVSEQRELGRVDRELDGLLATNPDDYRIPGLQQQQQDQSAKRNSRVLYVVLAATASALDAYVDAHLAGFDTARSDIDARLSQDGLSLALVVRH